jgi:hypothetical protein
MSYSVAPLPASAREGCALADCSAVFFYQQPSGAGITTNPMRFPKYRGL